MRIITYIFILVLLASCGTRRVESSKTKLGMIDRKEWSISAPGDRVYITAPRMEPQRPEDPDMNGRTYLHQGTAPGQPRETILRESGENGAQLTVYLAGSRFVSADCDCPDIQKSGSQETKVDLKTKEKESERKSSPWGWIVAAAVAGIALGAYIGWTTAMRRYL